MEPQAGRELRDHVIVCGLQGVGLRIVEQLHLSGTPVIVVDDDADPASPGSCRTGVSPTSIAAPTSATPSSRPAWPGPWPWSASRSTRYTP